MTNFITTCPFVDTREPNIEHNRHCPCDPLPHPVKSPIICVRNLLKGAWRSPFPGTTQLASELEVVRKTMIAAIRLPKQEGLLESRGARKKEVRREWQWSAKSTVSMPSEYQKTAPAMTGAAW